MESHRERMEITLCGGKPWGFSIKGGTESNRLIIVSKLERDGKGEASGLHIGDIIISVNEVTLCGVRRDAVELIKRSGDRLMLAVERAFPRNTIGTLAQEQLPPLAGHNSNFGVQQPSPAGHRIRDSNQVDRRNNVQPQYNNSSRNQPAGYIFSQNNNNKLDKRQVKETLKMVIAEKRDGVGNTHPEKGRRSVTSANEPPGNTPTHAGVKHRHENKKDVERPRSWHMSKHPDAEEEAQNVTLSPASKAPWPAPLMRRKSREWLESGYLRSELDKNSSESLLSNSFEHPPSDGGLFNQSSARLRDTSCASSRDRTSIHSNPSLMDAVQAFPRPRPESIDYDSSHSSADQSLYTAPYRSSQDSLNSSSISMKSYKVECPSSDPRNNVRLESSWSNKLRSSGRYGEIWKLPQVHRRAKSFDALSDDSPRQSHNNQKENVEGVSPGFSHSKSPSLRSEPSTPKSPSPIKSRADRPKESKERFYADRGKKGRNVDVLISSFEKGSASGQVQSNEQKANQLNEGRYPSEGKGILKRLQNHPNSSTSVINTRQHCNAVKLTPSSSASKFHGQSSGGSDFGLYAADPHYQTLPSWSDEYKKNIQGMSKKVLRVTSFTRKDLELSPPYPSPVHQRTVFRYPISINEEQNAQPSSSENSNGPKRAKSTSSLLENASKPVVSISTTSKETNFLREKQYCQSLSPASINHTNTDENFKSADEEVFENLPCLPEPNDDLVQKILVTHCDVKNEESSATSVGIDQTEIKTRSPFSPTQREQPPSIHDPPLVAPKTLTKPPSPPLTFGVPEAAVVLLSNAKPPLPKTLPTQVIQTPTSITSSTDDISETVITSTSGTLYSTEPLSSASPLPATSAYYQTSASKAKIIHLIQEKVDGGEIIDLENNETDEERNKKKIELLKRITKKWSALQAMKELLKAEVSENEHLGKIVKQAAEKLCTSRELERFKTFVEEIDKIFNLLFSISGRLARVNNTLATLTEDSDQEERNGLLEKKRKLALQQEEAILLKENVDKRQAIVSKILSSHLTAEEYADFEHYIKMKTALISEQRDVDDKMKLGEEQMRELYDSLPESLQDQYPLSDQYEAFLQPQSGGADVEDANAQCS